jgi:hypothetical protein
MEHTEDCKKMQSEHEGKRITHYNLPPELAADCDCDCHSGKDLDAGAILDKLRERETSI